MRRLLILYIKRRSVYFAIFIAMTILLAGITLCIRTDLSPSNTFSDPKNGVIVIDPGHGGIDGGTVNEGILEKEINLDIGKKLRILLQLEGYTVIMTREEDVSLDPLDDSRKSRHQRDLQARCTIINNCNAQLFLSIHVNSNPKKPSTDGAIVFYSNRFEQNKTLAYSIQRTMNAVDLSGKKRTIHDPVQAKYFILNNTDVPGVIIETAFISNKIERQEMVKSTFQEEIAESILHGVQHYLESISTDSKPAV